MPLDLVTFEEQLDTALNLFDRKNVARLCDELIQFLYESQVPVPLQMLERIMQSLRSKRMFELIRKVGECCLQLGLETYTIRRQYAQSLLDEDIYAAAMAILVQLRTETGRDPDVSAFNEYAEATGLLGRIYKQQYVNASQPHEPRILHLLEQSIQYYQEIYFQNRDLYLWHGINLVALIHRARVDLTGLKELPDPGPIALDILLHVGRRDMRHEATAFDFALALEGCIALDRQAEALTWADKYVNSPLAGAFEIASTLRQLREVWRVTMDMPIGRQLLPLLSAALLTREGATLTISTAELDQHKSSADSVSKEFERVLSSDSFKTYQWYLKGLKACSAVARIGLDTSVGWGTGFLISGELLSKDLEGKVVLLTNAHVISDDPINNNGSLSAEEAVATLEAVDKGLQLKCGKIVRTSSIFELDTTILCFDETVQAQLKSFRDKDSLHTYSIARTLPVPDGKERVYIIGHPCGGVLQISLQDNILLSCNDRLMHYRTPTARGSSGSPVFNDNWELIGIHHAGGSRMRKLDDPYQLEEANEGIRIDAIQKLFK
jgi:V8-like Glu-specific endopeptidase